ncbi:NAD-dependent DNA ligase LigA [Blattabacterium cuenoti]|uniref:NAD-dependent DNA ligase LigA n=1 Tax=Blattabacterium cuenoti TaxID=1653831 RepID=UPI00163BA0E5|nr:NAD-dependent DNA ligase LigA [Blattabacterium cuenoti]
MNKKEIEKKISNLRKELSYFNHKYYNSDISDISDYHFDKKLEKLFFLEKKYPEFYSPDSPTLKVGTEIHKHFSIDSSYHKYRMYSLQNTYSKEELINWWKKIRKLTHPLSFVCEPKYDGVSINLIYKNGFLIKAITRGNGKKGENVTENIKTIKYIPLKLIGNNYPSYLEIRGEIFLTKKNFLEINKKRVINGKPPYNNPRNTASGTLKIHNKEEVRQRNLFCIAFNVEGKKFPFDTQYESLKYIKEWGFRIPEARFCKNIEEVFHSINDLKNEKFPYHIDGIVIKVNEYKKQSILGFTSKYPRWAIAYKFRPEKLSETKLLSVTFQVGRTGIVTPVANVNPILISGSTIKRVSLYNRKFIQKIDLHHGDSLLLEKAGNVIPKITDINKEKRSNQSFPVFFLKNCPSCNSSLRRRKELLYCINKNCSSQRIEKIKHFVSEKAMNIQKIGHEMIEKLYKKGLLYNFYNLYELKKEELIQINRIQAKLADNIIGNIKKSKYDNHFNKVLYALGIPHVGEFISNKLSEHFLDINSLMHANYQYLISIPGVGKEIAESIISYFSDDENKHEIMTLMKYGLSFSKDTNKNNQSSSFFKGKSFVFTGKIYSMTRYRAKKIVEELGGNVYNTVNSKINFIIVGKNFGSKLKKSMENDNIKILEENVFLNLLKEERKKK